MLKLSTSVVYVKVSYEQSEIVFVRFNPQGPGPFAKRKDPGEGFYRLPIISARSG